MLTLRKVVCTLFPTPLVFSFQHFKHVTWYNLFCPSSICCVKNDIDRFYCAFSLVASDGNRRAYRECLENGSWRKMKNSSDPWRDDSECKEDQYFKDKVVEFFFVLRTFTLSNFTVSLQMTLQSHFMTINWALNLLYFASRRMNCCVIPPSGSSLLLAIPCRCSPSLWPLSSWACWGQ